MPRSETLSTDQFSGSGGDPDFTFFSTQFGEAFRTLMLPPVEGELRCLPLYLVSLGISDPIYGAQ
jgi:hypothetical protein